MRNLIEEFINNVKKEDLFIIANYKVNNIHDKSRLYFIKSVLQEYRSILQK